MNEDDIFYHKLIEFIKLEKIVLLTKDRKIIEIDDVRIFEEGITLYEKRLTEVSG